MVFPKNKPKKIFLKSTNLGLISGIFQSACTKNESNSKTEIENCGANGEDLIPIDNFRYIKIQHGSEA